MEGSQYKLKIADTISKMVVSFQEQSYKIARLICSKANAIIFHDKRNVIKQHCLQKIKDVQLNLHQNVSSQESQCFILDIDLLNHQNTIAIKKEREVQSDEWKSQQYRKERSHFFRNEIKNRLSLNKLQEHQQTLIIDLLIEYQQISLSGLGKLDNYKEQIALLKSLLKSINKQALRMQRQCLPLTSIISNKLNNLKVIRIQYDRQFSQIGYQCRYSISAFELFKIIHINRFLIEATLRGILVQQFKQMLAQMNPLNENLKAEEQRQEFRWISQFCPSKSLKISINSKIQLYLEKKEENHSYLNNFLLFTMHFKQVSDIELIIRLGAWKKVDSWIHTFEDIWRCMRKVKKIKIQIKGVEYDCFIPFQSNSAVRSLLFGGLATFTQISQLSFANMSYPFTTSINDYLAVYENMGIIFNNNKITHLKLFDFPILPQITTLQSIELKSLPFRINWSFMKDVIKTNPSLRFIKLYRMQMLSSYDQWSIDDKLFNQLQALIIECKQIIFRSISPKQPSKIKYLSLSYTNLGHIDSLSPIFPKLNNLNYLKLENIDVGHQLLCIIPSPHLSQLLLRKNRKLTNQGIKQIDLKWPNLKYIDLYECSELTESIWRDTIFKGIMQMRVDRKMFKEENKTLKNLKERGIKVDCYW